MANVIDTVAVQRLLLPFLCVLGKTLCGTFSCLAVSAAILNFDYNSKYKLKNNEKFQPDSNILAPPEAGQCNSLTVAQCIAPPTISCKSRSQEDKN